MPLAAFGTGPNRIAVKVMARATVMSRPRALEAMFER
jgi:hypothetical protein